MACLIVDPTAPAILNFKLRDYFTKKIVPLIILSIILYQKTQQELEGLVLQLI